MPTESITYKDAGVDIEAGDELVERIKPAVKRSLRPEVLGGLGGFGALFEIPLDRYRKPVLVSGTDGVGTKLRLAIETGRHDTIGIDLVAMCVNDVVVQGAEPLFFLDYYATGKLSVDVAESVIKGIVEGCVQAGAALIGGETAEMPGMYAAGDYDLAGFCVGIVEKDAIIDGSKTRPGDVIIGLPSSGPHSNGYSLIRKLLATAQGDAGDEARRRLVVRRAAHADAHLRQAAARARQGRLPVHSFAHITGGGLTENIPRVVPEGLEVLLSAQTWTRPPVFDWLQTRGQHPARRDVQDVQLRHRHDGLRRGRALRRALKVLRDHGEQPVVIGEVRRGDGGVIIRG